MNKQAFVIVVWILALLLTGCGTAVPDKDLLHSETIQGVRQNRSDRAEYEDFIVFHIQCELSGALLRSEQFDLPWLKRWGTAVTMTYTALAQSGASPGVSFVNPLHNYLRVLSPDQGGNISVGQQFSVGLGASAGLNATRTETIQVTYRNEDLLRFAHRNPDCVGKYNGAGIDGDLKIREFVFDKAFVARQGNASLYPGDRSISSKGKSRKSALSTWQWPIYNTFTEEINFLSAYGGSVTPSWKLARITADTAGSLLAGQLTYTNDVVITVGPLKNREPTVTEPIALGVDAQAQHNARVQGNAIATSVQGASH